MNIKLELSLTKGRSYYEKDGAILAECVFSIAGEDKIIIEHTEVDESLKGLGVGLELVRAVADYARKNKRKIIPLCPFANAMFKKYSEFDDVKN